MLLKEVKKAGEIHIVLDCSTEKIQAILKQASQVGMMTAYHNYLITSLVRFTVVERMVSTPLTQALCKVLLLGSQNLVFKT